MKRMTSFVGNLFVLLILAALAMGLVALLRGMLPSTGGQSQTPPTTTPFQSPLVTPTPAPTAVPTIVPATIPPPPQVTPPPPLPTVVPQPFPTPRFQPTPRGTPPARLQTIWSSYFPAPGSSPQLRAVRIDDQGRRWTLEPRAVDLVVNPYPPGPVLYGLHQSPDGRRVAADVAFRGSLLIDLVSGMTRPIITDPNTGPGRFLAWASDGRRAVVVPTTTSPEVWVIDVLTQRHQIIPFPQEEFGPYVSAIAYAPDGGQIADALVYPAVYKVRETWSVEIGLRKGENGGRQILLHLPNSDLVAEHSLQWSPNGQDLIFIADVTQNERTTQLWMIDVTDGASRMLAQLARGVQYGYPALWSPDGRYIAALKVEPGAASGKEAFTNVYLLDPETDSEQQLTHFADRQLSHLRWSPDGQRLAFTISMGDHSEIWVTDLTGQQQYPIAGPAVLDAPFVWIP